MAREHGLEEHKGKTIPKEVKSLADRIRKAQPGKSDEYAYRTAWDIFRSYTAEGKKHPNKSSESGLKVKGGGTGPLSKTSAINEEIWADFLKAAGVVQKLKFLGKAKTGPALNYAEMRAAEIAKKRARPGGTLSYTAGKDPVFSGTGKSMAASKETAKQKTQQAFEKRVSEATKGGYTDPQIKREMGKDYL